MTIGILAEKPSAARNFAAALGGMSGTFQGEAYVIAHARGHLYELVGPEQMVEPTLADKYKSWALANLPWNLDDFDWQLETIKGAGPVATDVKKALAQCDELVVACDVDPSGEGGMIAVNAFLELGLKPKKFSRMYFTDEAAKSLQKAFTDRKPIKSLQDFDEYKKATYRSKFDFSSMQFTRIATNLARQSGQELVLRQGRLKSAMVKMVGDQLKAYNDYVKKPFFQNRFRDENGVMYTNPDEAQFDKSEQVPQTFTDSPVVVDGKSLKRTAPPKLLDLASLSAILVGKGVKATDVLGTYQKMYEAQTVSYPRTDDKTITPAQFDELAPLVDSIAGVVGVDVKHLTHREPRKTHVKPQGAHGANRPGPNVPSSLAEVETKYGKTGLLIYETLAKNYLAMIAADYEYEQQKGHVEKYPDFKGVANVPKKQGWKAVFNADADEVDEEESAKGLGTKADPFVFEGANKRAEHPSMKWLMKQLEKRDVGTGATRTSTYSEVTNAKTKFPLLVDKRGKLTLAQSGEMSWLLLPNTHIGDLALTEKVYADMKNIAEGTAEADSCLAVVAQWVREDIVTMTKNAAVMRAAMGLKEQAVVEKERATGVWAKTGEDVTFGRVWSGHRFDQAEVDALLADDEISFVATARNGKSFDVFGRLTQQTFKGKKFVGFEKLGFGKRDANGNVLPPASWCGHKFSPDEVKDLMAGKPVEASDFVSAKTGNNFSCVVNFKEEKSGEGLQIVPDFGTDDDPPRSWCGVALSDKQRTDLGAGKAIDIKGALSKKSGKKFNCSLSYQDEKGKKKLVPSFK